MRKVMMVLALIAGLVGNSFAGNCDHSWDKAKDGSSCGDRAADRRAGGR